MGRVVKGAQYTQQTYQLKPPSITAQRPGPAIPYDDPIFADMHAPENAGAFPNAPAVVPVDDILDAARTEASRLLEEASADAEALIRDARERALALVDDAQRRVAQIEAEAKTQGFEQGESDGRAAAQAEMDEMLETMRGLVEMARMERYKIIESAEPEIVRLSVAIAERVLNQHVALDNDTVLEMTKAAITRLVNRETVTVRVNPADIETMRGHRDKLMAMNDIDNMRIIEDQRVDRGGVLIETDAGNIDAKISTQLREVRRLLAVEDAISVSESSEPALINPPAQAS
ncbi:MAG TPA: FliH/SctL family protein [Candidatus Baltobacteraceae bacterium]|nr:FliH/SctL family protein [Candidatus Baltobacteraceae bacterium]